MSNHHHGHDHSRHHHTHAQDHAQAIGLPVMVLVAGLGSRLLALLPLLAGLWALIAWAILSET